MFKKIKKFVKKIVVFFISMFNPEQITWIDKVLQFTETIKKAIDNPLFDLLTELTKIDETVLQKFEGAIDLIQSKVSYLGITFEDCAESENKIYCFVSSITKSNVPKSQRYEAFMQIALILVEKLGINIQSSITNARMTIEARYEALKQQSKL